MNKIEHVKSSFFSEVKRNFCNKLIVKLDKIINFCAEKKLKREVEKTLNEAEEFKDFSEKFYEHKDNLQLSIEELVSQNNNYKTILEGIHYHYVNENYQEVESIFERLGLKIHKKLKDK